MDERSLCSREGHAVDMSKDLEWNQLCRWCIDRALSHNMLLHFETRCKHFWYSTIDRQADWEIVLWSKRMNKHRVFFDFRWHPFSNTSPRYCREQRPLRSGCRWMSCLLSGKRLPWRRQMISLCIFDREREKAEYQVNRTAHSVSGNIGKRLRKSCNWQ